MEEDIATRTLPRTSYHIGCASWLDTSLLAEGTFYPSSHMTAEERLRWYALLRSRRGQRHLLCAPRLRHEPGVGRTHAEGLPVRREGLLPDDRAPPEGAGPGEG